MTLPALAEIAAGLYVAPPAEFVAARTARAAQEADPSRAAQIRALRKPSIAAWVVNVFAVERAAELGQALQLAQDLRDAQDDLDAATLATLGRQRRVLTDKLAREAADLASVRGERVTASTLEAVQQTIAAAFFDPDAAAAVASGRLVRELAPSTAIDLDAAVGGGAPTPAPQALAPADELQSRRDRRRAEQAVREAEQSLARAQREFDKADRAAADAAHRGEQLAVREGELVAELEQIRARRERTTAELEAADGRRDAAEATVASAEHALDAARRGLADLG